MRVIRNGNKITLVEGESSPDQDNLNIVIEAINRIERFLGLKETKFEEDK